MCRDNQEVGLEAATLERVRNSSLVERALAPTMYRGSRSSTEAADVVFSDTVMVGERCRQQRRVEREHAWSGDK